jgi:hypothetical protein
MMEIAMDREDDQDDADDEGVYDPGRDHRQRHRRKDYNMKKGDLANDKRMVTVYTEEDDDLVDEMPRGDRERMIRHNRRHRYRKRSVPRKRLHKQTQRVLQTNLQSHSWSRRESLQSIRHPGLSSEEALRLAYR